MERDEITTLALTELLQRSYQLMRKNNPEADRAFTVRTEITGRVEDHMRNGGMEAAQLYEKFIQNLSDTHSMEVEHAYVQGAKDCICLLRFLGML